MERRRLTVLREAASTTTTRTARGDCTNLALTAAIDRHTENRHKRPSCSHTREEATLRASDRSSSGAVEGEAAQHAARRPATCEGDRQ